tara:strand:+ start:133 stop:546 length:414 start_codon:yes stop_codon:yes gene_type:complete
MVDWEQGVIYKITPKSKKHIVILTTYANIENYDKKIIHKEEFRSGWVKVLGDEMSYYLDDTYNPDIGTDVWIFPTEDHEILDGVADEFSFSENILKDEQDKLSLLITEHGTSALEQIGWEHDDMEVWFFGELDISKE